MVTANAYYIHPIIARVAQDFDVSGSVIGLVPALNQVALALGIFFLLPLGDRYSNRRMISLFVACQCVGVSGMAFAPDIYWFAASSTLLGFFTIAPYLIPSYASRYVDPAQLGHVTATLTTGVLMGILFARSGAGVVGEYLGWRVVYYVAAVLMLATVFLLPSIIVDQGDVGQRKPRSGYLALLASLGPILRDNTEVLVSGAIQGLSFGLFLAIWLALGLYLTSPEMGYGVDVVGYLSLLAVLNLFLTPRMGRLADRMGARKARVWFAVIQALGMWLFFPFGNNLWLLIIPLSFMNIVGPPLDVCGRMLFLREAPEIRTRLMTVYIILMFLGGGIGSWLGTSVYEWGGWQANAMLAVIGSSLIVVLSLYALWRYEPASNR